MVNTWDTSPSSEPAPGQEVEIDWLGEVFRGQFIRPFAPWGTHWEMNLEYFSTFRQYKNISRAQIKRWRTV